MLKDTDKDRYKGDTTTSSSSLSNLRLNMGLSSNSSSSSNDDYNYSTQSAFVPINNYNISYTSNNNYYGMGLDSLSSTSSKTAIVSVSEEEQEQEQEQETILRAPCSCKKSRCLKLYCECFRTKNFCDGCYCFNCANLESNEKERHSSMREIARRNPKAFGLVEMLPQHMTLAHVITPEDKARSNMPGCSCKKSNCLKKYCECFNSNIKCTGRCRCGDCHNTLASLPLSVTVTDPLAGMGTGPGMGVSMEEALAFARQRLGAAQTTALLTSILMSASNMKMPQTTHTLSNSTIDSNANNIQATDSFRPLLTDLREN
eukprot:gene13852-29482_t